MRPFLVSMVFAAIWQLSACISDRRYGNTTTCETIEVLLPGKVIYQDTPAYGISNNYWSARQSDLEPLCFIRPSSAEDVSKLLQLLSDLNQPFTVKSGGHTAFPKGSSIRDGVTIDLESMNDITVSADRSTASIGPGNRWINVSQALDPLGLAVVGGRSPDVGVSGLILGGGISLLSGKRGWACDNVQNFQIVLASGEIVNANPKEHRDLYWALRGGGGSSFGIVTRFDVNVFAQGDFWGRQTFWPGSETTDVLVTFLGIARDVLHQDQDAHIIFLLGYIAGTESSTVMTLTWHLNHLSPPNGQFDTFEGLARLPRQIANQTVISNVSTHLTALGEPYGQRKTWWVTMVCDGPGSNLFMNEVVALWNQYAEGLLKAAGNRGAQISPGLVIQPVTNPTLEQMKKNGGNALGLEPGEFPLFLILMPISWNDASLDCLVEARTDKLIRDVDALAEERGFGNGFKYINYAGKTQNVFASYGEENQRRLKEVAHKYDPHGVLQKLWKGYFKVH